MGDAQTDRLEAIRQGAENIRNQNLLSDTFASVALEDIGACQHVLRTILEMDDLQVINVKSQYRLLKWKGGETIYRVEKTLGKSKIPYDDGQHVIYINAAVDDGSEIAKMMQYFKKADADDMTQGDLSKRVHYLKREKGGYKTMCEEISTSGFHHTS